jgi:hypothetical protein
MSNINCLFILAACVKEKALGDAQSLKLRGIMFVQLLLAAHTNQLDMPPKKTHHKQQCTKYRRCNCKFKL